MLIKKMYIAVEDIRFLFLVWEIYQYILGASETQISYRSATLIPSKKVSLEFPSKLRYMSELLLGSTKF